MENDKQKSKTEAFVRWCDSKFPVILLAYVIGVVAGAAAACSASTGWQTHTILHEGHEYVVYDRGGVVHKANCHAGDGTTKP